MRDFFTHEKISDSLYVIHEKYCEQQGFTLGLVVGSEKALLIDSGLGAVDGLRAYVETLTDKPIICVPTHCHPDHAGGAALFDQVYMSPLDHGNLHWALSPERRLGDLVDFSNNDPEVIKYASEHVVDTTDFSYIDLSDGMEFDLGGIVMSVLALPGHTPGSMAILNANEHYIFTGDAVSPSIMLTSYDASCVIDCHKALDRMLQQIECWSDPTIWAAHSEQPVSVQLAIDLRNACADIIRKQVSGDERTHSKFAELNDPDIVLYKHTHGQASITYNYAILEQLNG